MRPKSAQLNRAAQAAARISRQPEGQQRWDAEDWPLWWSNYSKDFLKRRRRLVSRFQIPPRFFLGRTVIPAPYLCEKKKLQRPAFYLVNSRGTATPPPAVSRTASWGDTMASTVQILGAPTADTGPCLLLHLETRRYIFGHVSEGTTRAMAQQKTSVRMIENIFVAGELNWESVGGMFGLLLTIADSSGFAQDGLEDADGAKRKQGKAAAGGSTPQISIHGAQELTRTLAMARNFVFRQNLSLNPHTIKIDQDPRYENPASVTPDWEDANIRVWYVPLVARVKVPPTERGGSDGYPSSFPDHLAEARAKPPDPVSKAWREGYDKPEEEPEQILVDSDTATAEDVAEGIVKDMFGDGFRFDVLQGQMLHDVPPKTKVYVRDPKAGIKPYPGIIPVDRKSVEDMPVMVRQSLSGKHIPMLPLLHGAAEHWKQSICYIVKNQPRRGRFDPDKAKKLGVRPQSFKTLTSNQPVTTDDGSIVTPEMVMEPPRKGHGFAVIALPSEDYIDNFLRRPEWSNQSIMDGIEAIYWLQSDKVHHHPQIVEFMERFPSIRHVLLDQEACPNHVALEAPFGQLLQLNRIDPSRFPIPIFSNQPRTPIQALRTKEANLHVGVPGATLQLAPVVKFQDDKAVPPLHTGALFGEIERNPKLMSLTREAQAKLADPAWLEQAESAARSMPDPDTEITTLGTGSALPGKYRNVSGTLVRVPGRGSWLLDCGENTLGQMRRLYGQAGLETALKDLCGIYISHSHADHHLGILSVIREWSRVNHPNFLEKKYNSKRLAIVASSQFHRFLCEYKELNDYGYPLLDLLDTSETQANSAFHRPTHVRGPAHGSGNVVESYGLSDITVCYVPHCAFATAVLFTWPSGLKIAYSGDCRPSTKFAQMAKGAHLLIHECTFDDDKIADAKAKRHSTMSEALDVGRLMEARSVLLTHFSQRYPKVAGFSAEAKRIAGDRPVLFGFDGMHVRLRDFREAELFLPAIRDLFDTKEEQRRIEHEISSRKAKSEMETRKAEKQALAQRKAKRNSEMAAALRKASKTGTAKEEVEPASDSSVVEGKSPRKKIRTDAPDFPLDQAAP